MTDKVKSLFFSQYLGQAVMRMPNRPNETFEVLAYDCTGSAETKATDYLLLRDISQLTDEEVIQIAKFAHQMPKAGFKVISRVKDLIHCEHKSSMGITHHISILPQYGTVNANVHFSKTDTEEFTTYKHNIGEITMSSKYPVPYMAIHDYLRALGFITQFTYLSETNQPITLTPADIINLGWAKLQSNEQ